MKPPGLWTVKAAEYLRESGGGGRVLCEEDVFLGTCDTAPAGVHGEGRLQVTLQVDRSQENVGIQILKPFSRPEKVW